MNNERWKLLKNICSSPSAIGYEASMTFEIIENYLRKILPSNWIIHKFKGSASIVFEKPGQGQSCMLIGHADKVRMQVRFIDKKGKIYIQADSMIPQVLIGNEVYIYTDNGKKIKGTIQSIEPVHYVDPKYISGELCTKKEDLYIETGIFSKSKIEELGINVGNPVLYDRPIEKMSNPNIISGAYLDNGVGCFIITELAKIFSKMNEINGKVYFAISSYEELNRFGSRVIVNTLKPDVIIAIDACHDYYHTRDSVLKRQVVKINQGPVITNGSVSSKTLNDILINVCKKHGIKYQIDIAGYDTGSDSMAGVFSSNDCASSSVGIPILNMHTISEMGSLIDIDLTINCLTKTIIELGNLKPDYFEMNHPINNSDTSSESSEETDSDTSSESSEETEEEFEKENKEETFNFGKIKNNPEETFFEEDPEESFFDKDTNEKSVEESFFNESKEETFFNEPKEESFFNEPSEKSIEKPSEKPSEKMPYSLYDEEEESEEEFVKDSNEKMPYSLYDEDKSEDESEEKEFDFMKKGLEEGSIKKIKL